MGGTRPRDSRGAVVGHHRTATVDRALLLRQRGRLAPSELDRLAEQLRTYLGL